MKPRTCFVAVYVALGLANSLHAQADCADWNTETFFEAAEVSDVTRCLQAGMDPDVLPLAALGGGAEAVRALLGAGAALEARDESGNTPLHMATNAEAIAALVAAGADLEARDESGFTPLHLWAMIGKEMTGKAEAVEALIAAGANLEARAKGGLTPLHLAASVGHAEAIEALLQVGADPKGLTSDGKLPFDLIEDEQLKGTNAYWKLYQAQFPDKVGQ